VQAPVSYRAAVHPASSKAPSTSARLRTMQSHARADRADVLGQPRDADATRPMCRPCQVAARHSDHAKSLRAIPTKLSVSTVLSCLIPPVPRPSWRLRPQRARGRRAHAAFAVVATCMLSPPTSHLSLEVMCAVPPLDRPQQPTEPNVKMLCAKIL
jgi:hypothetical protein